MNRLICKKSDFNSQNTQYICCDLEYFPPVENTWIPKSIGCWNATTNKFVRRIHLKSEDYPTMNHPEAVSIVEARRLLHILGRGKIGVLWNADQDLRAFPYFAEAFLGVHCAMIRYSNMFGNENPHFKDREFVCLSKAADQIEFRYLPDEYAHDEVTDARMTAALWNYCDDLDIYQDPYINQKIKEKLDSKDESLINLPPLIKELEKNDFELNESYKREQFKRHSISYEGNNIIVTYGNRYDENEDKVLNIPFRVLG